MTTVEFAPAGGLISTPLGVATSVGGSGPYDAGVLAAADGDTSYVDLTDDRGLSVFASPYVAPAVIPAGATIVSMGLTFVAASHAAIDMTFQGSVYVGPSFGYLTPFLTFPTIVAGSGYTAYTVTWTGHPTNIGSSDADIISAAAAGDLNPTLQDVVDGPLNISARITYLAAVITYTPPGVPPLRQFPRDDALGGQPRQSGSRSVQATARTGWAGTYR